MAVKMETSLTDSKQMAAADLSVLPTMKAEICFGGCYFVTGLIFTFHALTCISRANVRNI